VWLVCKAATDHAASNRFGGPKLAIVWEISQGAMMARKGDARRPEERRRRVSSPTSQRQCPLTLCEQRKLSVFKCLLHACTVPTSYRLFVPAVTHDSMIRKLETHCVWPGLLLFTVNIVCTSASRPLLYTASTPAKPTAFECGKPNGSCEIDILVNRSVTCEKGPGWCQPGYYCCRNTTDSWGFSTGPELCKPIPKDCGKAGYPCCPSNTDAPHGRDTRREQRRLTWGRQLPLT
jgi:hypothetical protein